MSESALNAMAAAYCSQLKSFITCVHTNSMQLRASATQKPPAYADLSSFLLDMGDRAAEDGGELELLGEMLLSNVSSEELLATCMDLYCQNEESIKELETQLEHFGYVKEKSDKVLEEKGSLEMTFVEGLKQRVRSKDQTRESSDRGSVDSKEDMVASQLSDASTTSLGRSQSQGESSRPSLSTGSTQSIAGAVQTPLPPVRSPKALDVDDMSMLCESFSLEDFGLSASTLASLARLESTNPEKYTSPGDKQQQRKAAASDLGNTVESFYKSFTPSPVMTPSPRVATSPGTLSKSTMPFLGLVSDEEYSQVFPWLQRRVPLTELNEAIVKINECLVAKQASMLQGDFKLAKPLEVEDTVLLNLVKLFRAEDGPVVRRTYDTDGNSEFTNPRHHASGVDADVLFVSAGPNMKACLLFLVQIDRLIMASSNGRTTYRPSELEKFR